MIRFHLLGPLRVAVDGTEVPIATRRQRALLVLLLLNVGKVVPSERLIDRLWDGTPPPQGAVTLRSYVSNIRQALGGPAGFGSALVTRGHGYCLEVPPESVDAVRMATAAQAGSEHLRADRPQEALRAFAAAVDEWGGDPLADVADHAAVQSTLTQLTETYLGAVEGRFAALLACGRPADALPGLEAFAADHPLREAPRAMLMRALYQAGRAPEAIETYRGFRAMLRDELGIDPSARLDELFRQILDQDPALNAAARAPASASPGPALVGRGPELAVVADRLDELSTGTGALLTIAGEPGIGKTTLLEALERQARDRGFAVHSGRSPAAAGAPAFWPWAQVVDSIASTLDDAALRQACAGAARPVAQLSVSVAERTGLTAPIAGGDPEALRFLLYDAVATFVRQATGPAPVVITLDDVHWADRPSLELLSYLTPAVAAQPVLLVAAYRDLPAERTEALDATLATVAREDVAYELVLTGLGPSDIAGLLDPVPGRDDAGLAAVLHQRTGGNPFFVRQLVRLGPDPASGPAPRGVRHVIARRLDALPASSRTLLDAAAVIGRDFDLRAAAAAAALPTDAALDAFDEAVRHGLVERGPDGDRRFVHALVQEVVADRLPAGRAARLHAGVAAGLERAGTAAPAELARHMWAARDLVGVAAVPSLVAAADAAAAVYAVEEAEVHLRHALELAAADPSTELSLRLSLFQLIVAVRGWGDAEVRPTVDRAMELAEAGGFRDGSARLWWSMFFYLLDRDDPSYVQVADRLLASIDDGVGPAARAVVHLAAIFSALDADDRDTAHAHLVAARQQVEAAPADTLAAFDEHLHVMLLLIEGYWAAFAADDAAYRATTDAAIALADADGRPFPRAVARTLAAATGPYLDDPAFTHRLAGQALELDQRFGFGWLAAIGACVHAWAGAHADGAADDGAIAAAARTIEAQLAEILAHGRHGNESTLRLMLADVYALDGRDADARQALADARRQPGPYRGLMVDVIDRRERRLGKEKEQR